MECSNVGSIIVTIALQMHGTIVDVKLSDALKRVFENTRLFSKSVKLGYAPSGYISESHILYKVNEMFQQNLNTSSLEVVKRYVEYSYPKYNAYLKHWYSDITTEEEQSTVCRLYNNVTIDKILTTNSTESQSTYWDRLCYLAEVQGIFLVSIHEKREENDYKLIYPKELEKGKNLNLLKVSDFDEFAHMFNKDLPDLNALSEVFSIEEFKTRKTDITNDRSLTDNQKKQMIRQQDVQIYDTIKSWNIQMENPRTIEAIKLSVLVKLIKNIVGPECKLNIFDYSCSNVTEYVLPEHRTAIEDFQASYAVSTEPNGELSILKDELGPNNNWGGKRLKLRRKSKKRKYKNKRKKTIKNR